MVKVTVRVQVNCSGELVATKRKLAYMSAIWKS